MWNKFIKICQRYRKNDFFDAGIIYLATLAIALLWISPNASIVSDHSVAEYDIYLQILDNGGWLNIPASTVVSCLFSTYVPAMLQLWLGLSNETLIFDLLPCLFFALMPAFIYLIARAQLSRGYSLCAVGLVLASSIFIYPNGRVGIALGLLSGMLWAVLSGHLKLSILFAIFVPFAHYGTVYIAIGYLAIPLVCHLCDWIKKWDRIRLVSIPLLVLVALTVFWHGYIFEQPFISAKAFMRNTVEETTTLILPQYFSFENSEALIQHAFGKGLADFTVKRKIGWVTSWLTVILLSLGLFQSLRKRLFSQTHRFIAVAAYVLLVATVVVPYISTHYGIGRVYYVGLITLAPMFGQGLKLIGQRGLWVGLVLLVIFSWATNGIAGGL